MFASRSRRMTIFTGLILGLASAQFLWVTRTDDRQRESSDRFWGMLAFERLEAEHYDSLDEMSLSAELVIVGTITDVALSRTYGGIGDAEPVRLASLVVSVDMTLAGRPASSETILLEVTLPGKRSLTELRSALPLERAAFFLRNKGTEVADWGWPSDRVEVERKFYRLVSSQGLLREIDERVVPPLGVDDLFLLELRGQMFAEVMQQVREK